MKCYNDIYADVICSTFRPSQFPWHTTQAQLFFSTKLQLTTIEIAGEKACIVFARVTTQIKDVPTKTNGYMNEWNWRIKVAGTIYSVNLIKTDTQLAQAWNTQNIIYKLLNSMSKEKHLL